MFGMSLPEIIVIAVIAVLFLGPDKLPSAMVEIAKFFKTVKKTVNDAKSSFDQEIKIQELKEDAKKYKESTSGITDGLNDVKKSVEAVKNPGEAVKNAVLGDNEKKEA